VTVGEAELLDQYERNKSAFFRQEAVRARHLVVSTEAEARSARRRIAGGEAFADVARRMSQSEDARRGGDLGFFTRGQMPLEVEEAAFALRPGELSPVIESPYGFHLLKVEEHRPARQAQLAEVREEVAAGVRERKREERYAALLEELWKRAEITYNRRHDGILPEKRR
jgi:parvulin-like peptidyl-prolyl isomerase